MATRHRFKQVWVLTGDHGARDTTKASGRYEADDLRLHDAMRAAVRSLDRHECEFLTDHREFFRRALAEQPDCVLNLCDTGFRNVARHELHVPALLELRGIPYTGAPPAAIAICYDKAIVRLVAQAHGVAVPRERFIAADAPAEVADDELPALIKPNQADGSVGITRDAVVRTPEAARKYLAWLRETLPGTAALVQEYLPGPEYGVGVIGNPGSGIEVLPPLQVDFGALPEDHVPILGYESKAHYDSPYYTSIRFHRAKLDASRIATLERTVRVLFDRLQLRDYARFDFRTAADGEIKLMEVNPNPAWDPEAKLALMTGFSGREYRDMFAMILDAAAARVAAGAC